MATLTVVKFPAANGADEALGTLRWLQSQQLIRLHDAAVMSWPPERKKRPGATVTQVGCDGVFSR